MAGSDQTYVQVPVVSPVVVCKYSRCGPRPAGLQQLFPMQPGHWLGPHACSAHPYMRSSPSTAVEIHNAKHDECRRRTVAMSCDRHACSAHASYGCTHRRTPQQLRFIVRLKMNSDGAWLRRVVAIELRVISIAPADPIPTVAVSGTLGLSKPESYADQWKTPMCTTGLLLYSSAGVH